MDKIGKNRLIWFGHVRKREEKGEVRAIMRNNTKGKKESQK